MNKYILIVCALFLVSCSCNNDGMTENVFNRLDIALADYASMDDNHKAMLIDSLGDVIDVWLAIQGVHGVNDSILIEYSKSRAVAIFSSDIRALLDNKSDNFKTILKLEDNICNYFSANKFYDLYSVVSPYNQSIFIADSIMFVGLNHYLGSDYAGYDYFEPYQRVTKTPQHLVYDIAEAVILDKFPYKRKEDETVLDVLLYNGAIVYAIMQVVPNADLAEALGYTKEQLGWAENNEKMRGML